MQLTMKTSQLKKTKYFLQWENAVPLIVSLQKSF